MTYYLPTGAVLPPQQIMVNEKPPMYRPLMNAGVSYVHTPVTAPPLPPGSMPPGAQVPQVCTH